LIADSPEPEKIATILVEEMTQQISIGGIPMLYDVDIKVGPSWGECEEVQSVEEIQKLVRDQKRRLRESTCAVARAKSAP
jgi:hypothetical protein